MGIARWAFGWALQLAGLGMIIGALAAVILAEDPELTGLIRIAAGAAAATGWMITRGGTNLVTKGGD